MPAIFANHALLPEGFARHVRVEHSDGVVTAVMTGTQPDGAPRVRTLLPTLPNLHSHTFQRAMAGLAETRTHPTDTFWTWREQMYRVALSITPEQQQSVAELAFREMRERGFGHVVEFHYLHNDLDGTPYAEPAEMALRIVAAAKAVGIGLTILPCVYVAGGFGRALEPGQRRFRATPDQVGRMLESLRRAVAGEPAIAVGVAPHSLRAVPADMLRDCMALVGPGEPVHIHVSEQTGEVEACLAAHGRRPIELLLDTVELDARWCLVHATHATASELAAVARAGATVALCPVTEANLGDGVFDMPAYLTAGGRFGIGTDSNVWIDAWAELRMAEYAQRLARRERCVATGGRMGSVGEALYASAAAVGQVTGTRIGALAPGHPADLTTLQDTLDSRVFAGT